jgi:sec-independent protein translocase protein TatB
MFDIGFWELVLISVVALLFIGPDQLPSFTRKIGRWLGMVRRFVNNTRRELEQELNLENHTDLGQKLSDLDDLMKNAPDQDPNYINKKSSPDKTE